MRKAHAWFTGCSGGGIDNPALDVAIAAANELGKPVVVFLAPVPFYPHANLRHYLFLLRAFLTLPRRSGKGTSGLFFVRFPEFSLLRFCDEVKAAATGSKPGWRRYDRRERKRPEIAAFVTDLTPL